MPCPFCSPCLSRSPFHELDGGEDRQPCLEDAVGLPLLHHACELLICVSTYVAGWFVSSPMSYRRSSFSFLSDTSLFKQATNALLPFGPACLSALNFLS